MPWWSKFSLIYFCISALMYVNIFFCARYVLSLHGNESVRSVNPLVAGTNDGLLNDVRSRPVGTSASRFFFLPLCYASFLFILAGFWQSYTLLPIHICWFVSLAGKEHVLEAIESVLKNVVRVEEGAVGAGAGTQEWQWFYYMLFCRACIYYYSCMRWCTHARLFIQPCAP